MKGERKMKNIYRVWYSIRFIGCGDFEYAYIDIKANTKEEAEHIFRYNYYNPGRTLDSIEEI